MIKLNDNVRLSKDLDLAHIKTQYVDYDSVGRVVDIEDKEYKYHAEFETSGGRKVIRFKEGELIEVGVFNKPAIEFGKEGAFINGRKIDETMYDRTSENERKRNREFEDMETVQELYSNIKQTIKDSGERSEFPSGAVRDLSAGKGRTDLLPLNVIAKLMKDTAITYIANFQQTRQVKWLYATLEEVMQEDKPYMIIELSKHFEKGAVKYEERNWEKGIPTKRYIDSAVRHYLKHLDGQTDENHFISFTWNLVCLIWTMENIGDDDE